MESNRRNSIYLVISLLFILFITILSRKPTLMRIVHLVPLWSFFSPARWKQILLNIALFVPFGYFLASGFRKTHHPRLWTIIAALAVSLGIELIQFFTYRGMLDVDDLVSNEIGAAVGLQVFNSLEKQDRFSWEIIQKKWMPRILLCAGLIGCIMASVSAVQGDLESEIMRQFWFDISSITVANGKTELEGECFLYNRAAPAYAMLIGGKETAITVEGKRFSTSFPTPFGKVEIGIKFHGFPVMPTNTWINGERVEYVVGVQPVIRGVPETAVLKAWNEEYDVLIYEDQGRILWLIGSPIDRNTEVIYHIHTNEPEKLPTNRVQYGFDNQGFRPTAEEKSSNELENIDYYRVFERKIPENYNITAINVGFNTDGRIIWKQHFRVK